MTVATSEAHRTSPVGTLIRSSESFRSVNHLRAEGLILRVLTRR